MKEYFELLIDNTKWKVKKRYENLTSPENYAVGAYGSVCFADDSLTGKKVAIKKLSRPFDARRHANLAFRELHILKHVDHDNIIKLIDAFTSSETAEEMSDFYLVTDFMENNLYSVIRPDAKKRLEESQIQFFGYQILRGLKYLHSCNIIHRDLKPENIIINQNLELKLIDFGQSRSHQVDMIMTPYIITRYYRAPDVKLFPNYSHAVDLWSFGCIFFQMYTQDYLFRGLDEWHLMNNIIQIVGWPSEYLFDNFTDEVKSYFQNYENRHGKPNRVNFSDYFHFIDNKNAINLMEKIFVLDPNKRVTVDDALKHSYFEEWHDPEDEPTGEIYNNEHENDNISVEEWKALIFKELMQITTVN